MTVMEYVPIGAAGPAEAVRIDVPDPVRRETESRFSAWVMFATLGDIVALRSTLPAKLFRLFRESVKVASDPWGIEVEAGLAPIEKSGFFGPGPVP